MKIRATPRSARIDAPPRTASAASPRSVRRRCSRRGLHRPRKERRQSRRSRAHPASSASSSPRAPICSFNRAGREPRHRLEQSRGCAPSRRFPGSSSGSRSSPTPTAPGAGLTFQATDLKALHAPAGSQGVRFGLTASKADFVIDQTVLATLCGRCARSPKAPANRWRCCPNSSHASKHLASRVDRHSRPPEPRRAGPCRLTLRFPSGDPPGVKGEALHVHGAGEGPLAIQVDATVPYPPPTPVSLDELIDKNALAQLEQLDPADPRTAGGARASRASSFSPTRRPKGAITPRSCSPARGASGPTSVDTVLSALMRRTCSAPRGWPSRWAACSIASRPAARSRMKKTWAASPSAGSSSSVFPMPRGLSSHCSTTR